MLAQGLGWYIFSKSPCSNYKSCFCFSSKATSMAHGSQVNCHTWSCRASLDQFSYIILPKSCTIQLAVFRPTDRELTVAKRFQVVFAFKQNGISWRFFLRSGNSTLESFYCIDSPALKCVYVWASRVVDLSQAPITCLNNTYLNENQNHKTGLPTGSSPN